MSALLAAYDRGVDIRIVFDSWSGTGESGNEPAYELLEQVGAQVYYDLDTVASHNKLVIVDNETVFLGSANWTESGLTKNREASILIRDIQASRAYKAYVDELVKGLPGETKPRVPIPLSFLKEGGIFRRLYIKGGIESLRLYTWLIWEAFNRGTFILERDYKRWYGAIYAEPVLPWSVNKSRRISTLVQYLEKTGAIVREKGGEEITLVDLAEKVKDGRDRNRLFVLPEFWTLGWIKKLSGPGLYFYFINLAEFKKSPYKPVWLNSEPKLSWEYGMGRRSIRAGLKELMSYNLIEVEHDIPEPDQSFNKRKANRYFINSLWGEEEWQSAWTKLVEREGLDLVLKARGLAARINEPYDLRAVSSVIGFIHRYGEKAVTEVIDKVMRLSFQNGKWELRYIAGILQRDYSE